MKKLMFVLFFIAYKSLLFSQGLEMKTVENEVIEINGYKISLVQYKMDADSKEIYDRVEDNRVKIYVRFNIDKDCVSCVINRVGEGEISVFENGYRYTYKINRGSYEKKGQSDIYTLYNGNKHVAQFTIWDQSAVLISIVNTTGRYYMNFTELKN